jgi:acetyl-CoA C-acetyltransferase
MKLKISDDDVVIVAAKRTPIGAVNGMFRGVPAYELGEAVIKALLKRTCVKGHDVSEIVLGQIMNAGAGPNPSRQAAMRAGIPKEVVAWGLNQLCGSGMRSICFGYQAIRSGDADIVIAGGQENMTRTPHLFPMRGDWERERAKFEDGMFKDALIDPFYDLHTTGTAENIARRFHITREEQDELAAASQNKCEAARKTGRFEEETVAIENPNGENCLKEDQIPRDGVTTTMLSRLKPTSAEGTVTAGNSSGIADGASAVMLMRRREAKRRGLEPMAVIVSWAQAGVDPAIMGIGPVPACRKALDRAGWTVDDLDLIEANESFAAQAIYVNREMKWDLAKVPQYRPVHRHFAHRAIRQFFGTRSTAGAEEGTGGEFGAMDVFLDGLRCDRVESDRAVLVSFFKQADCGFALVQVEIFDFQTAAGGEPDARIDIELKNGAIPVFQDRFARGQVHQLAGARHG